MEASAPTRQLESFSPLDGRRLGTVPAADPASVQGMVDDAAELQPFWAALPLEDRARYMGRAAQVILDRMDELSELLSREQGKPRTEAFTMELLPSVDSLRWIAAEGPSILEGERVRLPAIMLGKRARHELEPLGVVGVIAPWNYPWSIPFAEVAIALMCGNGVVLKPAELTPLIGQRIQDVFERAGVPTGLVRAVHGAGEVGSALVESSVSKVLFTGSVETGRLVGAGCAARRAGGGPGLRGQEPMIVCTDANLANAVSGCLWGGFANAGQTGSGIERVYVVRDVAGRFVEGVGRGARELRLGDPLAEDTEIGPMVSRHQFEKVCDLVDDAVEAGATLHCGGPAAVPGHEAAEFYAPAVLTGVTHDMRIMREEVFGPVVPIIEVEDEEEAVRLANDSSFGLGASVWTLDRARGQRIAGRLEAGMVWLNDHMYSHGACSCAWGGVKKSGLGRAHSRFGFYECVNVKLVAWEPSRVRDPWWHPYDATVNAAWRSAAQLLYGRDADKPGALREGAAPLARLLRRTLKRGSR